eukprot:3861513-Rhodomonas_salina.1
MKGRPPPKGAELNEKHFPQVLVYSPSPYYSTLLPILKITPLLLSRTMHDLATHMQVPGRGTEVVHYGMCGEL